MTLTTFCLTVIAFSAFCLYLSYWLDQRDPDLQEPENHKPQRPVMIKRCDICEGIGCDHCLHTGFIEDKEHNS